MLHELLHTVCSDPPQPTPPLLKNPVICTYLSSGSFVYWASIFPAKGTQGPSLIGFYPFFCVWRYFKNLSLYYQCCHFYHYFMRCHHTADLSTLEIFSRLINFQCTYIFEMPKIGWFYGYYLLWGKILSKILSTVIQPMQK